LILSKLKENSEDDYSDFEEEVNIVSAQGGKKRVRSKEHLSRKAKTPKERFEKMPQRTHQKQNIILKTKKVELGDNEFLTNKEIEFELEKVDRMTLELLHNKKNESALSITYGTQIDALFI